MHYLIGFVTAIMVLFPASDSGGVSLYQRWMDAYEKYLYQQMYDNFERARNEQETGEEEVQKAVRSDAGRNAGEYSEGDRSIYGSGLGRNNGQVCGSGQQDNGSGDKGYSELVGSSAGREGVTNEQAASEEAEESHDLLPEASQNDCEVRSENSEVAEEQTEVETSDAVPPPTVAQTPLFSVNGAVLDIGVQEYLYQRLCEANIGWFYHYAILIAYQESRFDPLAVNPNGKDFGLFQFRLQYHPDLDWANPYAQVDRFVLMMANRAANGKTAAEMISAHNVSDYAPYNQEYVSIVMSHEAGMVQIR